MLKNLKKLDAVKNLGGRPARYDAIHPRMVVERAVERLGSVCDRGLSEAEAAWEIRAEEPISADHKGWVVEGVGGRISEIRDLMTKATRSVLLVVDAFDWLSSKDEERISTLSKEGVNVTIIGPGSAEDGLKRLAAIANIKVRSASRIGRTACIVDDEVALWGTERPAGGSVVRDEVFAEMLKREMTIQYQDAKEVKGDAIAA